MSSFKLSCLIHGNFPTTAFEIEIDKNESVDKLRDVIKEKRKPRFNDFDVDELTLWKVNIPISEEIKFEKLRSCESSVKKVLDGKKLKDATKKINDYFLDEPLEKHHIHIIIEPPAAIDYLIKRKKDGLDDVDIPSGLASYFLNINFEKWSCVDCLKYLAKVCAHLTSEDRDEIIDRYKAQSCSISLCTSMIQEAKTKALRLSENAERSFQRREVDLFFDKLDTRVTINAIKELLSEKEKLYELMLKIYVYDDKMAFLESTSVASGLKKRKYEDDEF